MNKKILIVEDDISMQEELKALLENTSYGVTVLKDFANAKEIILNSNVDLVLLDVNIPYLNGELLLKELRKESNIPVIILTSRASELDEALSISYGADDFITKPYNPTILLLRIQNIFRRLEQSIDDLKYDDILVNPSKGTLSKENKNLELTKNEMIVFTYLLANRGKIVPRDDLMTDLWNNNEFINDNALTVNISRLRTKLETFGLKDVIETRKGQGYKLL